MASPFALPLGLLLGASIGVVTSAGCAGSGKERITEDEVFTSLEFDFEFEYITPLWTVKKNGGTSVQMEVETMFLGKSVGDSPPTHLLLVGAVDLSESIEDLLPEDVKGESGLEELGVDATDFSPEDIDDLDELETGTGFEEGEFEDLPELPEYLRDIDIKNPRDVAFAELSYLIEEQDALIDKGVQVWKTAEGLEGVVYQAIIDPGVFVRTFYLPSRNATVRMAFASVFDLETPDVEHMASTLKTNAVGGGL